VSGDAPEVGADNAVEESAGRQPISYCPFCAEETLFPREGGGWECRSCLRAFSVKFLGLVSGGALA
jgi:ribosomal protein L37AE/L43A